MKTPVGPWGRSNDSQNNTTALTDYQLPITNYRLPITNYQLPITNYQLPITNYQLPITNYQIYELVAKPEK
ncbi:MAG: hypothetical protein HC786_31440 [Richelia sp. CSU_2_1]|nr:hypothetical protein [Richelia sp. CSU_2_1]